MSIWLFPWRAGWFVMGKVRTRKETGKLYLDFMYAGHRCREQTALMDTPQNRKRVNALLQKVEAMILLGDFNYAEYFPRSEEHTSELQSRPHLVCRLLL